MRERVGNVLQDPFGIHFFAYFKISEDDVEEPKLVKLLRKDLLPLRSASFVKAASERR